MNRSLKYKIVLCILSFSILVLLSGCSDSAKITSLMNENDTLETQVQALKQLNAELEEQNSELQAKIDEAKPWFELSGIEKKAKEEELQRIKDAKVQATAEKAEAERLAKEAEEKKGYDTGITFDQLARTPDEYISKKVKFSGTVIQVIENYGETQLRVAIDSDYEKVIYVSYTSNIISSRVLEDDVITIMGVSKGLLSYQSTMGGTITIPSVLVEKIEFIK